MSGYGLKGHGWGDWAISHGGWVIIGAKTAKVVDAAEATTVGGLSAPTEVVALTAKAKI